MTIHVGEHFVKATYFLERDGPLVFPCYEKLKALLRLVRHHTFQMCVQWWLQLPMKIQIRSQQPWNREPAIQSFLQKFSVDLYNAVMAFKAARVMCPVTVGW